MSYDLYTVVYKFGYFLFLFYSVKLESNWLIALLVLKVKLAEISLC